MRGESLHLCRCPPLCNFNTSPHAGRIDGLSVLYNLSVNFNTSPHAGRICINHKASCCTVFQYISPCGENLPRLGKWNGKRYFNTSPHAGRIRFKITRKISRVVFQYISPCGENPSEMISVSRLRDFNTSPHAGRILNSIIIPSSLEYFNTSPHAGRIQVN